MCYGSHWKPIQKLYRKNWLHLLKYYSNRDMRRKVLINRRYTPKHRDCVAPRIMPCTGLYMHREVSLEDITCFWVINSGRFLSFSSDLSVFSKFPTMNMYYLYKQDISTSTCHLFIHVSLISITFMHSQNSFQWSSPRIPELLLDPRLGAPPWKLWQSKGRQS